MGDLIDFRRKAAQKLGLPPEPPAPYKPSIEDPHLVVERVSAIAWKASLCAVVVMACVSIVVIRYAPELVPYIGMIGISIGLLIGVALVESLSRDKKNGL